jgi:hypothetical protein
MLCETVSTTSRALDVSLRDRLVKAVVQELQGRMPLLTLWQPCSALERVVLAPARHGLISVMVASSGAAQRDTCGIEISFGRQTSQPLW